MKYLITIILILIAFSCNNAYFKNDERLLVTINKPIIKDIIAGFKQFVKNENANEFITLESSIKNDITIIKLINYFPDFRFCTFQYYDTSSGNNIIYIGENDTRFYRINAKQRISEDLKWLSESTYHRKYPPPAINPYQWIFQFKDDRLVSFEPKNQILEYVQTLK